VYLKSLRRTILIIPAYNPPFYFVDYVKDLVENGFEYILVVDDGSRDESQKIFETIKSLGGSGLEVLVHDKNMGKGRALKDAFKWVLDKQDILGPHLGVLCLDSDGQHLVEDVVKLDKIMTADHLWDRGLFESTIYLGRRNFDEACVPFRNRYGNKFTRYIFRLLFGVKVGDSQTGMRGLPLGALSDFKDLDGDRFEYEMNMLIEASRLAYRIKEGDIKTHYVRDNSESHFRVFVDSFKIYRLIFRKFFAKFFN